MAKKYLRTPLVKPRQQGGTFYTFGSALEDIGLNINELHNKVGLTHYVLLNLPEFNSSSLHASKPASTYSNNGDCVFADGFQNYALNMETVMRNQESYDFSNSCTVSERVFWKWLKECGIVNLVKESDSEYYVDTNQIAKGFGLINSGAQRSDDYSMYNETFVQIPSSFGQMKVLYKVVEDDNYYIRNSAYLSDGSIYIENIDSSTELTNTDLLISTGISGLASYDTGINGYNVNSCQDSMCVEFDITKLRSYYDNDALTFDTIAIDPSIAADSSFDNTYAFNAILIYYSIFDTNGINVLATNAYGLLVLNKSIQSGNNFSYPSLTKAKATSTMSGSSYSFRLNIKTSSVYSGDIMVNDNATAAYSMATDFNDVIKNLNTAINVLRSNTNLIATINTDNTALKEMTASALDKVEDLEKTLTDIKNGTFKNIRINSTSVNVNDSSIFFNNDGEVIGVLTPDAFGYPNISAYNLNANNLVADSIKSGKVILDASDHMDFTDNSAHDIYAKINGKGVAAKGLFVDEDTTDQQITESMANTAIDAITTYYDSNNNKFAISANGSDTLTNILKANNGYIDIEGLLALLITKIKNL